MLIYKNDGTLHCISKKALKLAGYSDVAQFLDEHNDFSELFVKRPGYIYNFENFSWLSFLRNANPEQKKVLIATRDNATYECELEMETLYPVALEEGMPEFYIQIEFKNLHLSGESSGTSAFEDDESSGFTPSSVDTDLDRELIDRTYETFEEIREESTKEVEEESTHVVFGGTSETEEKAPIFETSGESEELETAIESVAETPAVHFETPEFEQPATQPSFDQPLDLVDFALEEEEKPSETAKSEKNASSLSIEEAFADLGGPEPETGKPEAPTTESSAFETVREETTEFAPKEEPVSRESETKEPFEASVKHEISETTHEVPTSSETPAMEMPDLRKVAATLGLPETMIKAFIKEFVDTYFDDAHEVEMALASGHVHVAKKEAMKLKGIAGNLMMEPLVQTLESILAIRSSEEVQKIWRDIDNYLHALAEVYAPERLAGTPASKETVESTATAEISPAEVETTSEEKKPTEVEAPSEVRPLHLEEKDVGETIVFDPTEAADALGLPESLIVEFVHDFVEQAREEKETFEKAFEAGDLTTVNETAHKLKGVAANLRIEDMRELMEKTQHATDFDEAQKYLTAFYHKLAALAKTMAKEFA